MRHGHARRLWHGRRFCLAWCWLRLSVIRFLVGACCCWTSSPALTNRSCQRRLSASTAAARLVRTAGLPARLGAGLFYAVNPFVFDRLYVGQLGVLLGYALLPFAVTALLDAAQEPHRVGRAACWAGAAVMMSEHFAWILVPVTAAILLTRPQPLRASLRLGGAALGAAAISSYLLVAPLLAGASPAGPLAQL